MTLSADVHADDVSTRPNGPPTEVTAARVSAHSARATRRLGTWQQVMQVRMATPRVQSPREPGRTRPPPAMGALGEAAVDVIS
jgi:hypothetical protein